ncbi:MAG: hypothetical protein J7J31_01260 [Helicobacteraceae bacterium]|nr:hypothetical protein [Helicobacteraceae bacterium]
MKQESYDLFKNASVEEIVEVLDKELQTRNESPFWTDKVLPFSRAILSVLVPLRDNKLLFIPEGNYAEELTPELFMRWSDFVSLKTLAFTIQISNDAGALKRTKIEDTKAQSYQAIDLQILGDYLSRYTVNLEDESLDFPISHYNLHQGVSNVIKSLL